MQVVFSEEFSFLFSFFFMGEVRGGLGRQGMNNQQQGGRTFFPKTYLFLVYFLILLELKLYEYLTTISNQNACHFTVRLLFL